MLRPAPPPAPERIQPWQVERHFPGVSVWWGQKTGLWLALVPGARGLVLLEETNLEALARRIQRHREAR